MIRRLLKLNLGLVLFGTGLWLGLVAELGVGPWDVLTGGLSEQLGVRFGLMAIAVSVVVLLIAVAARVRPGIGTVLDDAPLVLRLLTTLLGIATVAAGSALYLGSHLGPGPRDGLMVAIHLRTGWQVGTARAVLECVVLVLGVLLGGPVGVGTLLFALGIGPAVQVAFRVLRQTPVQRPVEAPA